MNVDVLKGHAVAQLVAALRYTSEGQTDSVPDVVIGVYIDIILPAALRSWG